MNFEPRNELGIIVMPPNIYNGTYLVYLPQHGHHYVAPRLNVKAVNMGPTSSFSVQDGKQILTSLNEKGSWHIGNKGQNHEKFNILSKMISAETRGDEATLPDAEQWLSTSTINSSIAANYNLEANRPLQETSDTEEDVGYENRQFGRIEDAADPITERNLRTSSRKNKGTTRQFDEYLTLGAQIVNATKSPSIESLMKILSKPNQISASEIQRKNPTMSQALGGPEREHWIASKEKEDSRLEEMDTFEFLQDPWKNS